MKTIFLDNEVIDAAVTAMMLAFPRCHYKIIGLNKRFAEVTFFGFGPALAEVEDILAEFV